MGIETDSSEHAQQAEHAIADTALGETIHAPEMHHDPPPEAIREPRNRILGEGIQYEQQRNDVHAALFGAPIATTRIGRFVVLEKLGQGGMGVVFAAYDPELDRKVAIKLMREDSDRSEEHRVRTRREAQSMARLSHPNVVQMFEVGEHDGQLFLAMEFVRGRTLGAWLSDHRGDVPGRSWQEVIDVFVQAGRGLMAAHAAGLVHRDFKPDNVMVGNDGRVRVMDFGLARPGESSAALSTIRAISSTTRGDASALTRSLTSTGAILGTPAYMSPEQFESADVDARSDQFSLCVSLYEGLYGERPFSGDTWNTLMVSVLAGQLRQPPAHTQVPAWLRTVVIRGLERKPSARWPSIKELLAAIEGELSRANRRRRSRRLMIGAAASVFLGTGVVGANYAAKARARATCETLGASIEEVWPGPEGQARERVRDAALASGLSYAEEMPDRLDPWLDDYAARWQKTRRETCVLHRVEHSVDDKFRAQADACLWDRKESLAAVLENLAGGDKTAILGAVPAVTSLPTLEDCADAIALRDQELLPEETDLREPVADARRQLLAARSLATAGATEDAVRQLRALLESPAVHDWPALRAEVLTELGRREANAGEVATGEGHLTDAVRLAGGRGHMAVAAEAAAYLITVVGIDASRPAEALVWNELAQVFLERSHRQGTLLDAERVQNLAKLKFKNSDLDEARAGYERALAINERLLPANHPDIATNLGNISLVLIQQGALDNAEDYLLRARQARVEAFGEVHPRSVEALSSIAHLHFMRGDYDKAEQTIRETLELAIRVYGAEHSFVARTYGNLGAALSALGKYDEAFKALKRNHELNLKLLPPDHDLLALSFSNLGSFQNDRGEFRDALALLQSAQQILEQKQGSKSQYLAGVLEARALAVRHIKGSVEEAEQLFRRALALYEQNNGPMHANVATSLGELAYFLIERGEHDEAATLLERAWGIAETLDPGHADRGYVTLVRAQLARTRGQLEEAERHYQYTLDLFRGSLGPESPQLFEPLYGLGRIALARGQHKEAREHLEQALALLESTLSTPEELARVQFALAQALVVTPAERTQAIKLARLAVEKYERYPEANAPELTTIRAWLVDKMSFRSRR